MSARIFSRLFLGAFLILGFLTPSFSADKPVESKWTPLPQVVDGQSDDWSGDTFAFEKSANVDYSFRNDSRNLYVLFIFKDPQSLSTIDLTGMTIYFSAEGKKKKNQGITFIKKNISGDELIAAIEKQGQILTEGKKQELRSKGRYVMFEADVIKKKSETAPSGAAADIDPPSFKSAKSGNGVIYEFRVPLASPADHPAGIGAEPGKSIKVGFEWGGMTEEMRKAMMERQGEESARASGMEGSMEERMGAGNRSEGMPGGESLSMTRMRQAPKKYSFWTDVKLAQNP